MLLTSPTSVSSLFIAKLIIVSILILSVQTLFMVMYWVAGQLFSISEPFPTETVVWSFRGWISSISIAALQLGLSIRIRSFATPIGISLCAAFLGLGMYILKIGMFFPYSLLTIGMSVLSQRDLTHTENISFLFMNCMFITLFAAWSIHRLKNKDVASS